MPKNNDKNDLKEQTHGDDAGTQPEPSPERRRDSLRKLLAGGGIVIGAESLPGSWSRPLIDSVVLPAHAQTSLADPCSLDITETSSGVDVIVNGFVSPPTGGVEVEILVELLSGGSVVDSDTTTATTDSNGQYTSPSVALTGAGTDVRATTSLNGADEAVCQQPLSGSTTTTSTTSTTFTSTTTSSF